MGDRTTLPQVPQSTGKAISPPNSPLLNSFGISFSAPLAAHFNKPLRIFPALTIELFIIGPARMCATLKQQNDINYFYLALYFRLCIYKSVPASGDSDPRRLPGGLPSLDPWLGPHQFYLLNPPLNSPNPSFIINVVVPSIAWGWDDGESRGDVSRELWNVYELKIKNMPSFWCCDTTGWVIGRASGL